MLLPAAVQSVRSCAAALLPYVGEDMLVEDVSDFLTQLGGIGAGLQELLEISPSLGKLFGGLATDRCNKSRFQWGSSMKKKTPSRCSSIKTDCNVAAAMSTPHV